MENKMITVDLIEEVVRETKKLNHELKEISLRWSLIKGELEKSRELFERGLDGLNCLQVGDYQCFSLLHDNIFIETTKLLTEYGLPVYDFGDKLLKEIQFWEELSAGKWIWLLKNGVEIPRFIDETSLSHCMFKESFHVSNTEEEQSELLFWLFQTKNVYIFEKGKSIFDIIVEEKKFYLLLTIETFLDTFDEKTITLYKQARMMNLFS